MNQLTKEQLQRIEENRQKALQKRAEAQNSNQSSYKSNLNPNSTERKPTSTSVSTNGNVKTFILKPSVPSENQKSSENFKNNFPLSSSSKNVNSKTFLKSLDSNPKLKATFVLLSRERFYVEVSYNQQVIEAFKSIPSRVYDATTKRWNFSLDHHSNLMSKLRPLNSTIVFSPLPTDLVKLFQAPRPPIMPHDLSAIDPVLLNALFPFQEEGIQFGIRHNGRVLIADDMGLGKTIQALAIANFYKSDWPLLVVAPSSVKYSWADAITRWLPSEAHEVAVINSGKDHVTTDKIVIMSYDLLSKKKDDILRRRFKSVIMDESHFLKNSKSSRTVAAQQIMVQMKRIVMLSGTPALSRPVELFPQISAINSKVFKDSKAFGIRYCNGKMGPWGWDFSGSSNLEELQLLLEETTMVRRLKSKVLSQLPPKVRQVIMLDSSQLVSKNKVLRVMSDKMAKKNMSHMERRGVLLEYYHETGVTKLPAICGYIQDLLESDKKFICFAHHQAVLNGIQKTIEETKADYMRIDGATPSAQRKLLCDKFQMKNSCKVALLSITAANSGITLTSAHLVVFAELFWNPGILVQAEDRAHRIGQEDSVVVQYLVAKGSADDEIWMLIQSKLDNLNKAGLTKDNFSDAEAVKAAQSSNQMKIDDFWHKMEFTDFDFKCDESNSVDNPLKRKLVS